eukprot:3845994-Prymnesium_polylepis.1
MALRAAAAAAERPPRRPAPEVPSGAIRAPWPSPPRSASCRSRQSPGDVLISGCALRLPAVLG